jgi:lysylphosphatidylglycerol synthetase-like protein (DUF2156 family)
MKQKLGITLIAAWYAFCGLMLLLLAVGTTAGPDHFDIPVDLVEIGAVILFTVAIIAFAVAYGIYNREGWAWIAAMILATLSIVSSLCPLNIFGLVIPGLIIWYLWTNMRDFDVTIKL